MHCLASCDRPRVTCHLPRERNCPNPLNFLHGQDKVVGAPSRGDALGDAASHIPLGTSAKMKRNGRTNAGRREVRQQQLDHQGETHRAVERAQRRRAVSFSLFSQPCTVIHREVAACGFILSQSDYRSGASSSCGLCLSSVLPRPSVCLLPGPSSLQSAAAARASELRTIHNLPFWQAS